MNALALLRRRHLAIHDRSRISSVPMLRLTRWRGSVTGTSAIRDAAIGNRLSVAWESRRRVIRVDGAPTELPARCPFTPVGRCSY